MPSSENTSETQVVSMRDFPGLVLNADPREVPAGAAQEQVNVVSVQIGHLASRKGLRVVTFDGE
jgi:hypothetical protein